MTAFASMQTAVEAINETAFAYLVKPFEADELLAILGRAVEHQRLRRALQESEARYRLIMDAILDAVFLLDVDGRLVYANHSAETMSGYRLAELVGRPAFSFLTPTSAEQMATRLSGALGTGGVAAFVEVELVRKDGALVRLETHETPIVVEGRVVGRLSVARDITERERLRERLAQTQKLAAMGNLLAGVAHELNNPLTVVTGNASMLVRHADPVVAERAARIETAAERCARIVRSFVALARSRPAEHRLADLNQVVRAAVDLLSYALHVDSIKITQQLDGTLPPFWGDPHQLHQVVVNLIANAHHALRSVEGLRRLTLTTRLQRMPASVVLEVADTGPGIPAEVRPRLFEPFFTTKAPGEGTGLGLALCHSLVEAHGGHIDVESQPGRGACFRVVLPLGEPPAGSPAASTEAAAMPAPTGDILVVDDETDIAAFVAEILVEVGHRVDTAAHGLEALERLGQRAYDLVISDIRMPHLDGPGLYRAAVEERPELARRFIFVTGDTLDHATRDFLEQAGLPTIEKPLDIGQVQRLVAARLDRP
jgi:two-component system NtrC family sensor kinase